MVARVPVKKRPARKMAAKKKPAAKKVTETMPATKKAVKDTAIRLWKNDFDDTPIKMGSTEWELYLIKAEQIENAPTVIDTSETDQLYRS